MKKVIIGSSHAVFMAQHMGSFPKVDVEHITGPLAVTGADGEPAAQLMLTIGHSGFFDIDFQRPLPIQVRASYAEALTQLDQPGNAAFLLLGGNEHNLLFMVRHPQPFDFYDPRCPAPLLAGRQIIPRDVVRAQLEAKMRQGMMWQLTMIRNLVHNMDLYFVAPPAPIASEEYIRSIPEVFDFTSNALEDKGLRLKIYRLYLDILEQFCRQFGVTLLLPSDQYTDADGFLLEPYWNHCTHATPAYYRHVTEQFA